MKDALESFIKDAFKQQNKQQKKQRQLLAMTSGSDTSTVSTGGAGAGGVGMTTGSGVGSSSSNTVPITGIDVTTTGTVTATTTTTGGGGGGGGSGGGGGGGAIPQFLHSYINVVHSWMDSCQGVGCGQGCALSKSTTPTSIPVALLVAMKQRQEAMMELIDAPGSYSGNIYPHLHQQGVGVDKDLVNNMYNAESASEEQDQDPEEDVVVSVVQPVKAIPVTPTSVTSTPVTPVSTKMTTETTVEKTVDKVVEVDSKKTHEGIVESKVKEEGGGDTGEELIPLFSVSPLSLPEQLQPQSQLSQVQEQALPLQEEQQQSPQQQSYQEDTPTDEHLQQSQSQSSPPLGAKRNSKSNSTVFPSLHPPTSSEHGRALHTITVPASLPTSVSSLPVSVLSHDIAMVGLTGGSVEEHCRWYNASFVQVFILFWPILFSMLLIIDYWVLPTMDLHKHPSPIDTSIL